MDEYNDNRLADEFLESLRGMQPAEPNPFFYTKLKGRMQHQYQGGNSFFKPGWIIGILLFFLTINTWMIIQEGNKKQQTAEKKSPAQVFAETYNLNSDSNY
jgi:hypothetical protein